MRKLNEQQQKELERMRDWSLTILEFMIKHSSPNNPIFHQRAAAITRQTYERGNLRGMRLIFRDVKEWATGMNTIRYAELKEELMKKFGETLP